MTEWENGLASTKVRPPMPPASLVRRSRLHELLEADVRFVLVCASAGSGKSTLLASWLPSRDEAVAWLQVESPDSDPGRFWSYLLQAIDQAVPISADVRSVVRALNGDEPAIVSALVNELSGLAERLTIVIDDYHLIDGTGVHEGVERLIELCPQQVKIVIATRMDPPFRLGRFRVRGQLAEIRGADLRFAPAEATRLLAAAGRSLDGDLVDQLCQRTEGWAAGLVLAGLSLRRATDPRSFVTAFRGDDQLVVEYLRDELLANLTDGDRQRLLGTSILEQLSGPLVDAVTESAGGAAWLEATAASNQLLIRLSGSWYRYHHLLRDLLRLEAGASCPERIAELHARAATWFEAQGDLGQAIAHRLAANDLDAAARLLLAHGQRLLQDGQVDTLRTILTALGARVQSVSWCALFAGWCEYLAGHYAPAETCLATFLDVVPPGMDVTVATSLRINISLARGDVAQALTLAREVDVAGKLPRSNCDLATATGAAYAWAGQADDARRVLRYAADRGAAEGFHTGHVMALVYRSVLELVDGTASAGPAAQAAIDAADAHGLGRYHGVGSAVAVRARCGAGGAAHADVEQALTLARRASTDLALGFVLTACADTLLSAPNASGSSLLAEAQAVLSRCPDPGVVGRYFAQTASRHGVPTTRVPVVALVEQLTERELAVLRYLPGSMSHRQISRELYVSLNTTKTHCSAIYRKLGVSDRKSAVQTARDLALL